MPRGEKPFVRPGETTAQVMARMRRLITRHRPDLEPGQSPLTFTPLLPGYLGATLASSSEVRPVT